MRRTTSAIHDTGVKRLLSDALRRIGNGEFVVDPTIVSRLVGRGRHGGALMDLTERERECLLLRERGRPAAVVQGLARNLVSPEKLEAV